LHDRQENKLIMLQEHGFPLYMRELCSQIPYGDCLCGLAAETCRPFYCHHCLQDDLHSRRLPQMTEHGHVVLPLLVQERLIGVLCLYQEPGHEVSSAEKDMFTSLASIIAVALENALHTDRLEKTVRERTASLKQALDAAEAANRSKSDFIACMSHELKTPLNAVIGFSSILEGGQLGELNPDQSDAAKDIFTGGRELLEKIESVIFYSALDSSKNQIQKSAVQVGELLARVRTNCSRKAAARQIIIENRVPDKVADLVLFGDDMKIGQALSNLLDNAVKFSRKKGKVVISAQKSCGNNGLRTNGSDSPGNERAPSFLEITVSDKGIGIPREKLEEIFEPFYQIQSGIVGKTPGTGMGLTLARKIVELHGGVLQAESDGPDQGSRFTMTLPLDGVM